MSKARKLLNKINESKVLTRKVNESVIDELGNLAGKRIVSRRNSING